jgi:mannose-6-phosphate isomerase
MFDAPAGKRIGEVWFTNGADLPLLAKYIFTSERLSIQVHPNDQQARARGLRNGKSECWYIVDAEPQAVLGLGPKRRLSDEGLRRAALDGSIEHLLEWRPVRAADFYFVPAGTIHAIGGGLTLLEFQQNSDITYRLYDYGRPRELHVDDAVAAAQVEPYPERLAQHVSPDEERLLVDGPLFSLVHCREDRWHDRQRWVIPLEGKVRSGTDVAEPGECLVLEPGEPLASDRARMLVGAMA